ncbi:alpha/beta hydrolase [Nocardia sp. CDC160]|uniref:alpha/beta hydrolase n=1 Tax=Nocardia sp. CDC160 TaxID=3112166 RepID=UPI002DBAB349|nr:alpha/beta hydrolase family protein [Nocardia sp. CDC160]MEC3917310.1 alpha/beta hydrolase family protein [Nocardia sp. CDC160]
MPALMRRSTTLFTLSATVCALSAALAATSHAEAVAPDGSRLVSTTAAAPADSPAPPGATVWSIHSAAMDRDVPVLIQHPADDSAPRPVLYLLNGDGGGEDSAAWDVSSTALQFLSGKDATVVEVLGGRGSYYTDWRNPDPVLGVNKWRTFLTEELPPIIDAALNTNGTNAIAALSSSATSVLQLAEARPDLYRSVASYSGCAQISDPLGHTFVSTAVAYVGGDADNMYGPEGDPDWAANDPVLHADRLRGVNLYLSTGSGLPGPHDTLGDPFSLQGLDGLANQVVVGGAIEAATNLCTHLFAAKLATLGIPATVDFEPTGTHSWGYWNDALAKSWPVLAAGLGLPPN